MSKYEPLWKWIRDNGTDSFKLTYAEIEEIAGVPIDHSFLKYAVVCNQSDFACDSSSWANLTWALLPKSKISTALQRMNWRNTASVSVLKETAEKNGIVFKAIKIESREDTKNAPTPVTTYSLFCDGEYITNGQMNDKKFLKPKVSLTYKMNDNHSLTEKRFCVTLNVVKRWYSQ